MTDTPNFLFIMTDQLHAGWLGCAGHPVVKTPNIDALAAQGTRFTQFHVATPVCMPNRASLMTGRMPSVHGLRYNGCTLPERAHTFVDVLRAGGYATASIGKSHLQPFTEVPPDAWTAAPAGPISQAWQAETGDYGKEAPDRYRANAAYEFPTPYYGFDHVDVVTGHGDQAGGHYQHWFRQKHPKDWQALTDRANQLPHSYTCPQAYRTPIPADSYPTAYIRDRAKDYLTTRAAQPDPFFAFVSFHDPHHPFNPPGKYWDMYDPDDFPLPGAYEDHDNPPPPLVDAHQAMQAGKGPVTPQTAFMAPERQLREAMALTAGMITMIDDAVGEIVQTLKDTGQFDNTVIIFNSDHGDYLGDCGLLLKGAWARDSINRVPMIWSDPATRQGQGQNQDRGQDRSRVSDALASTIDLSATILDRAGLAPYFGIQGQSFLPCLSTDTGHRDALFIEYNDGVRRMGFDTPARMRSLLTQDWQLSVYRDQSWGELYDRKADPTQTTNLWDEPDLGHVRAMLFEQMTHHLIAQMDEAPLATRLA